MKKIKVYTMENCPYCSMAKKLLEKKGLIYEEILLPLDDEAQWDALYKLSGMKTMPQIFFGEKLIGGYSDLAELDRQGMITSLL